MKAIIDSQFQLEVLESKGLVLVDFWAEWCGPCRQLGPILEQVDKEIGEFVEIIKMNVDEAPNSASQCGIRSIPTMFLYKDGKQIDSKIGLNSKETIVNWVTSYK